MPALRTAVSLTELLKPPTIQIVNVGASEMPGISEPYEKLIDLGFAELTGFEPNSAELAKLRSDPRRRFLPQVVGAGEPATFYETNHPWTGSLFEPDRSIVDRFVNLGVISEVQARHAVSTHKLDDLVPAMDFLKIDVQGAELDVMKGAVRLLRDCVAIHIEVEFLPLYRNQPLFGDVDAFLRGQGFFLHTIHSAMGRCLLPFIVNDNPNKRTNQVLWGDVVYVRDFRQFTQMPSGQLRKLAVILNDMYGSADFCLQILMELDRREGTSLEYAFLEMLPAAS